MIIALDYDGTFTEDPIAWAHCVNFFRGRGHEVIVVTMRYPSEDPRKDLGVSITSLPWYFTGRTAKKHFLDLLGIHPNIWIDDHPQAVFMDAEQIWGATLPEGQATSINGRDHEQAQQRNSSKS